MNNAGIYLHLPFCLRRCGYCDFYSTDCLHREEEYVAALCRHLHQARQFFPAFSADTLYFGGGTPSLLKLSSVERLLEAVNEAFPLCDGAEITLEANPSTVDRDKLRSLKALGVNRISLGIQSTCDRELSAIGRLHSAKEALDCAAMVAETGFSHFSVDLMYALPHQTRESFLRSLHHAAHCGADHVSAYCLTLSENVPLAKHSFPQADEDTQRAMYLDACEYLESEGLFRYEISNFAREGCHSRHNEKYWLGHPTPAFGAGAVGYWDSYRYSIPADLEAVIASPLEELMQEEERLSDEDRLTEALMLSLRTKDGLSYRRLQALGPQKAYEALRQRLEQKLPLWRSLGLVREHADGFSLTHEGAFVSNAILADLM